MKQLTKVLLSASAVLTAVAQVPSVQAAVAAFVAAHPGLTSLGAFLVFMGGLLYHPAAASNK
jgi:hypothetical protein